LSNAEAGSGGRGPGYGLCLEPHYAWVQRFFSIVPGARGYLAKEKIREADILIRRYVASRLDEAAGEVEAARQVLASRASQSFFASTPMIGQPALGAADLSSLQASQALGDTLRRLHVLLQGLSSDVLYADAGWAPVGAAQAIREPELRQLCSYDDAMIGLAEAILALARRLRGAVEAGDYAEAANEARELEEAARRLRELYEERRRFLHFVTHEGLGLREALGKLRRGAGGALEAARSLLERLARRLGGLLGRGEA